MLQEFWYSVFLSNSVQFRELNEAKEKLAETRQFVSQSVSQSCLPGIAVAVAASIAQ
jgi:hypothetical protein